VGAGLLRAGIYDEGVFGCLGYHGSAGSLPEQARYGRQWAGILGALQTEFGKADECRRRSSGYLCRKEL